MSSDQSATLQPAHPPRPHTRHHQAAGGMVHFPILISAQEQRKDAERMEIYVRSGCKRAIKMRVPGKLGVGEVKEAAETQLGIPRDQQVLHLNGQDITNYAHIQLQPHSIIHVTHVALLLTPTDSASFTITLLNSFAPDHKHQEALTLSGSHTPQDILSKIEAEFGEQLKAQGATPFYSLLQSSRLLQKQTPFCEQGIAKNADLLCLITKHELKTRFYNHTNEDIIHDISALLDSDAKNSADRQSSLPSTVSQEAKSQVESEREQFFNESAKQAGYQRSRRQSLTSEDEEEPSANLGAQDTVRNFKKKTRRQLNYTVEANERPLLQRIKANRSRIQLDLMLKVQGKDDIFYLQDVAEKKGKTEGHGKAGLSPQKTVPSIPKTMPVDQRRKIKLEMQKLFDPSNEDAPSPKPANEEQLPKSPPTEDPPRIEKRKERMDKLRLSMGSRPAFLSNFKASLQGGNQ